MSQDSKTRPEFNDAPGDDDETLSIQTIIERLKRRSLASAAASNKAAENGLPQPLDAVPSPAPLPPNDAGPLLGTICSSGDVRERLKNG